MISDGLRDYLATVVAGHARSLAERGGCLKHFSVMEDPRGNVRLDMIWRAPAVIDFILFDLKLGDVE